MNNFMSKRLSKIVFVFLIAALSGNLIFAAEKHAHNFGNWTSNKDATCCNDGTKSRNCNR